ncbi:hypothetical protein [Streptomyces sp. NPDC007991]|uniref:hypothetical protein n=1 Tax=Streptomyces sp. NPDC007991 TaxID=3364803 RepID=UPI0036E310DE
MPALSARRIASSALCATLALGVAAPAALAADTVRDRTSVEAPVADAATLQAQVQQLGYIGTVVSPVTALMDAALKVEKGELSATEAAKLGDAARAAIARAATAVQTNTTASATPAAPVVPNTPPASTNQASVPLSPTGTTARDTAKAAETRQGLEDLQSLVDALLAALSNPAAILPAITDLALGLVSTLTGLLGNLPGLPVPLSS